jgi:hypothetical protein
MSSQPERPTLFGWRGPLKPAVPPQVIGEEITRLRARHGAARLPSAFVDASRPVDAPCHAVFEWDDTIAGERYRRRQAGDCIRNIITVQDEHVEVESFRAFVSVRMDADDGRRSVYVPLYEAMSDAGLRQQLLADALRDLEALERKYRGLGELAGVFRAAARTRKALAAPLSP